MNKKLVSFFVVFLCVVSVFAYFRPIINLNTKIGFDSRNGFDSSNVELGRDKTTGMSLQDYFYEAFARYPQVLDLGFECSSEHFDMVFDLDFRESIPQRMSAGKFSGFTTNIPFADCSIELNFPRVGFITYKSSGENFFASIGRRQLKWGYGSVGLAISNSQPYLDNAVARVDFDINEHNKIWYDFTAIGFNTWFGYGDEKSEAMKKNIFGHRFGFSNKFLNVYVGELNLIYGNDPTLYDCTPIGIWHNNYQDERSNVMLDVAAEGVIGPVRIYGEFTMDDFVLGHEHSSDYEKKSQYDSSKPFAAAYQLGAEVHVLDGKKINTVPFNYSEYVLADKSFKEETGLNVGAEFTYVNPFMYNRSGDEAGRFTVPFHYLILGEDIYDSADYQNGYMRNYRAFYLGCPYGVDTKTFRLYAKYVSDPFEGSFDIRLKKFGAGYDYISDNIYGKVENQLAYMENKDKYVSLSFGLSGAYQLTKGVRFTAEMDYSYLFYQQSSSLRTSVGASVSVFDIKK